MSFLDRISTTMNAIQRIKYKTCPKCKREMYLARWFSSWTCDKCDIVIEFTKEEQKLVNKFEKQRRLTRTGKNS